MRPVTVSTLPEADHELVVQANRGNRPALEELFRRYREPAYRVAYRLLGNAEDALDAVQDGFIKVLTHLRGFEQRCSFKTWLLRVVCNAALDVGRQRRRREKLALGVGQDAGPAFGTTPVHADPVHETEESDLRQALAAALLTLPASQRQAFVLHVDGGLSYREVADAMGISIGTVMSRLFYARQKLKGLLAARAQT